MRREVEGREIGEDEGEGGAGRGRGGGRSRERTRGREEQGEDEGEGGAGRRGKREVGRRKDDKGRENKKDVKWVRGSEGGGKRK